MPSRRVAGADPARMTHEAPLMTRDAQAERAVASGRAEGVSAENFLKRGHARMEEAVDALKSGDLDRRSFLRVAAVLGLGVGAAGAFATSVLGPGDGPAKAQSAVAKAAGPKFGGALTCAMPVGSIGDPAQFEWVAQSNILRHQNEYLTITGADDITRPMLAAGWAASRDLTVWTFRLRDDVFWRSGARFTAADAQFNFARWLDPTVGSSNRALLAALSGPEAVELVDETTLRLHLSWPSLAIPESLHNYPAAIMPRDFDGDVLGALKKGRRVDGTGAYVLTELTPGERAVLRHRRLEGGMSYWGGRARHVGPGWLDEIRYVHIESAGESAAAAVLSGRVDLASEIDVDAAAGAEKAGVKAKVLSADSAQTGCMRMRLDAAPFDNPFLRKAVQLSCAPEEYPKRVFAGRGRAAEHHHVAPRHPDYYRLPRPAQNIAKARALLRSAGYRDGIDLTLEVGATSGVWEVRTATLLAEQAAAANIRISVKRVSAEEYRRNWKATPFGLTQWTHRPLGTMALALGYRSGAAWNETGYARPDFDKALAKAEALINIRARRRAMRPVQRMLQSDAVMAQPVWAPVLKLAAPRLRGLDVLPTRYHHFNAVWVAR
ncbi:MAG: ABC transporter substrate-binding protein [Neomegalonema sp.]|nr:ABC transporter substrate-binding protein [Neomegalonema sp.]